MAANFAHSCKTVFLLVLIFAFASQTVQGNGQHTCAYPQACTNPGNPDPNHTVTSTARFDPATCQCVTTPPTTGPHDCQKFATLAACQSSCGQACH